MNTNTTPTIKIVILQGKTKKSRKGKYIHIKQPGYKAKYFKLPTTPQNLERITIYYNQTKKTITLQTKQKIPTINRQKLYELYHKQQKPTKKIKKNIYTLHHTTIDEILNKGTTTTTITNIHKTTQNEQKKALKKILTPITKDKQLLDILTQPHNLNQYKHRLEYKTTLYNKNKPLITTTTTNTTPQQHSQTIKKAIEKQYEDGHQTQKTYNTYNYLKKQENHQTTIHNNEGNITKTITTITFRKNKWKNQ